MEKHLILALFLAGAGSVMVFGPLIMMRRYYQRMHRMSEMDLIDDEVRNEGTALFITGGIVFWLAAIALFILHLVKGGLIL